MKAEVDSETRKYLRELDSFGAPPDLYDIHSEAAVSVNSRPPILISDDFRQKLHKINVNHQKVCFILFGITRHVKWTRNVAIQKFEYFNFQTLFC